jgi:predicted nuclease of predicted toxin-antitoxin system
VKILLDECIDRKLASEFPPNYSIKTVHQMRWTGLKNGELLRQAEVEFEVFITVDRNLAFQQHLPKFDIAVLVLHTVSNRLADLKLLIPQILNTLPVLNKGQVSVITRIIK